MSHVTRYVRISEETDDVLRDVSKQTRVPCSELVRIGIAVVLDRARKQLDEEGGISIDQLRSTR